MTDQQPYPEQFPQFEGGLTPQQPPKRRRRWPWITGAAVALLVIAGIAANASNGTAPAGTASNSSPLATGNPASRASTGSSSGAPSAAGQAATPTAQAPQVAPAPTTRYIAPPAVKPAPTTTTENTPAVPPQEQQAIGAAQDYLSLMAFSRDGLIRQLSSSAGDGYPKDVATAAVDSLGEDWNAQAAKAAANYLSLTHFSCSGLIQQLDSSAGDQYTVAQATYGAHQTSACSG